MATFERQLALEMERWEARGLRRSVDREVAEGRVDFVSNDYLGLSRHPDLISAAQEALAIDGAGGRASRLLGGGGASHTRAEDAARDWLGAEAALLFPSGYQANLGVVSALVTRGDAVFSDARNHASIVDAARLSRARVYIHAHLDLDELDRQLASASGARRRLVVTEAIFSMDGDAPHLAELALLCERRDAWLVLDEAHSIGLSGPEGAGAWAALGRADDGPLVARILTGGKALGVGGALVVGSNALREQLVNRARSFVFTTAPPPALAAALAQSIEVARGADTERARVSELARGLAERLGLAAPAAAILPVVAGTPERALEWAAATAEVGLDVRAVRPPTVPDGASGLRVVLHAFNTEAECDELARALPPATERAQLVPASAPTDAHADALFVVGTDTDIGKTVVSAILLRAARRLGKAAYWKPVQTGTESGTGEGSDTHAVGELAEAAPHELLRPAWSFPLPASPHEAAADVGQAIDPTRVHEGLAGLTRTLEGARIVVELAGGLLVPYRLEPDVATQADWLATARVPHVLVARSGLGTLNHTLLTLEALRARHLEPRALFLVGDAHASNRATLVKLGGFEHVFELPWFDALTPACLDDWLDKNDLAPVFAR